MSARIGLILVGGSLKGVYAHYGVLKSLCDNGLEPSVILGASAGSVIASFYATGFSFEEMEDKLLNLKGSDFVDKVPWYKLVYQFLNQGKRLFGLIYGKKLLKYMQNSFKDRDDFSNTKLPLFIAATDLTTRTLKIFSSGTISDKIRASTAIPTIFYPHIIDDHFYIDGALTADNLPMAILERVKDLDMIIISNMSRENRSVSNEYLFNVEWAFTEIIKRAIEASVFSIGRNFINDIPLIQIVPEISGRVNLLNPSPTAARQVISNAYNYTNKYLNESQRNLK